MIPWGPNPVANHNPGNPTGPNSPTIGMSSIANGISPAHDPSKGVCIISLLKNSPTCERCSFSVCVAGFGIGGQMNGQQRSPYEWRG
jgi:hypothetical protein